MPEPLDYYRSPTLGLPPRVPVVLAVLAATCFFAPFGLIYALRHFHRMESPVTGLTVAWVVLIALILWLASSAIGLCGAITGVMALRRDKPTFWLVFATAVSGTVALFDLVAVAAGFLRTFRLG